MSERLRVGDRVWWTSCTNAMGAGVVVESNIASFDGSDVGYIVRCDYDGGVRWFPGNELKRLAPKPDRHA